MMLFEFVDENASDGRMSYQCIGVSDKGIQICEDLTESWVLNSSEREV